MAIISTKGLTKRFGSLTAVDHIDLRIEEGEIFGFLGPNGAGKTTTINMLTTLLKPDEGVAIVAGYDVTKQPNKVRENIGIIFQDMTVDRNLTAYENLYIHAKIYGIKPSYIKQRIKEVLEFVELTQWEHVILKNFSGGMIRRLEIARGLMHLPNILFMDEPTLGLDPQTRAHIWEYIEKLRREAKITIFLTTHYMDEAERLCDRVAIIDHGKIIALGTPEELIESIGGEVVTVKTEKPHEAKRLVELLNTNGAVIDSQLVRGSILKLTVKNASKTLPEIFDAAYTNNIRIAQISYSKPTLEDVFLKLTGRTLRDETWSSIDHMRNIMMRRMRR